MIMAIGLITKETMVSDESIEMNIIVSQKHENDYQMRISDIKKNYQFNRDDYGD